MIVKYASILALDVGDKRVGVSIASVHARLPRALTTLTRGDHFFTELLDIIKTEDVGVVVVGLPRNLNGQHTEQTRRTEAFIDQLKEHFTGPIHTQDEAVTSRQAETELRSRSAAYTRGEIDALAATYILEDFLHDHQEISSV